MVVDSGVATYEAGPLRAYCRSTRAHSELFRPRPADPALAAQLGVAGRFVVTYCGTIGLAHGLEVVLRAAAALSGRGRGDIVFLLTGDGARLDELRAAAASARLDNVVFTGRLEREAIPAVLATSDAGLPLVLGVRGFAQRFVEDADCGVCIAPGDADELVEAVLRLADDPALRLRLGQAGHALAARFDRDRLAARYLEIVRATRPAFR